MHAREAAPKIARAQRTEERRYAAETEALQREKAAAKRRRKIDRMMAKDASRRFDGESGSWSGFGFGGEGESRASSLRVASASGYDDDIVSDAYGTDVLTSIREMHFEEEIDDFPLEYEPRL